MIRRRNNQNLSRRDEALVSWVRQQESKSLNRPGDDISQARSKAYDRYMGRVYGNELDGYSKVRTREVLESVEWAMPPIVRAFLHSPEMCRFKPVSGNDVKAAMQETKTVNHIIRGQLNAWDVMNSWFRDTLLYPNGYSKLWVDEIVDVQVEWMFGLKPEQLAMMEQEGAEILEAKPSEEMGLFDARIQIVETKQDLNWMAVPPDEVRVAGRHYCIDLDDSRFTAHVRDITRIELIEMGHDESLVMDLPQSTSNMSNQEKESRATFQEENPSQNHPDGHDFSEYEELVEFCEAYAIIDYDEDGHSEFRKICTSGAYLLENEETNYQPLIALGAIPQSHRHTAISMFDLSEDIQEINTTQTRQMLDNLYRTNRPRQFAGRGVNMEQLQSYSPFGVVEMNKPDDVITETIPSVISQVLPAIEAMRSNLETRTGTSRMMNGMDADKLAETTLGAFYEAMGVANNRLEFIVRCFAETGIKKMCLKVHQLVRTRGIAMREEVPIGGKWEEIKPTEWRERRTMEAQVGLGTGTQRERISAGMEILSLQKESLEEGLTTPSRIFANLQEIVQAMGRPDAGVYFIDPESEEYEEGQKAKQEAQTKEEETEQGNIEAAIEAQAAPKLAQVAAESEQAKADNVIDIRKLRMQRQKDNEHFILGLMKINADKESDQLSLEEARRKVNETSTSSTAGTG
jgi:hypothetical protein